VPQPDPSALADDFLKRDL